MKRPFDPEDLKRVDLFPFIVACVATLGIAFVVNAFAQEDSGWGIAGAVLMGCSLIVIAIRRGSGV